MFVVDTIRIKEKMGGKDMSKAALARKIGITTVTLDSYFKNPSKIPHDKIVKIAEALELTEQEAAQIFFHNKLT